jgi:hypothetical protein
MTGQAELAADDPLAQAFSRAMSLAALQQRHPCYHIWAEQRHGRTARYLAQRRPGASCHPYAVITADPAGLDQVLTAAGRHDRT